MAVARPIHRLAYARITACGKFVPEKTDVLLTSDENDVTCRSCIKASKSTAFLGTVEEPDA